MWIEGVVGTKAPSDQPVKDLPKAKASAAKKPE